MKSSTRLESAVFHLTPTRTRCDLIITAKGKTEKIASGLLNPFLAQLKTAQDQIAQGGYSIRLEPGPGSDATWFTKGTVERFVRFVSTPEILERVYTLESEILQIEEAIAIQSNNDMGLSTVEDRHVKLVESVEGSKCMPDTNDEKAIVLYKPGAPLPEANGSTGREENSKVQLLRVLETRKTVLQKEQGMAFARAVAAGFDIDHMASLMSFSESFGASRLMDACSRFIDLWKAKHETGQWLEIEAAEAMSSRSDFSSMNASGIMLSNVANKTEDSGKASIDPSGDEKHPKDHQVPAGHQEYFQGHFPHQMYPPWPIHSPPGAVPVFQPYPMQGLPYYPNYPGNGPFFQPPYPSGEDPRSNGGQRVGPLRHSMDSKSSNTESEILEMGASRTRSLDDSELEKEASQSRESRKASGSGKKKSGVVVIRNINYITSKRQNSSGSESQSASESETDEDGAHLDVDAPGMKQNISKVSTKRKGNHTKSADTLATVNKETFNEEAVGGHWQAFQNCLLRGADEDKLAVDHGMFSGEGKFQAKRRLSTAGQDPLVFGGQHQGEIGEGAPDFHKISGDVTCLPKESNDELLINRDRTRGREHQIDVQFTEAGGKRVGYRRTGNDDFLIHGRETQLDSTRSSDPLALNGFDRTTNNLDDNSSHNLTDESFIVPLRSIWRDQDGTDDRNAIDMDLELPSTSQKADNVNTGYQVNYEPDDLGFMPDRGIEKGSIGYDPALDYEMQVRANNATSVNGENKEAVTDGKRGLKSEKERRSKVTADTSEKKKLLGATRKGKPSKLSPLDEARARAEKLRSFKADLQKVKKEKEAEEIKRLEALKIERQRRIAAKSSGIPAKSPLPSPQTRKQLPTKLSPSSQKGSKFSDSEPGSVSPLQRIPIRAASLGSSDSQKPSKVRSIIGRNPVGNKLSHSASSLPESKKESDGATPESRASMARIRRLSEPKMSSSNRNSTVKLPKIEPISKSPVSDEPESKKISAIMNLDRTKAATLPELKIRTSKVPSDLVQNKSSTKEVTQNVIGSKSSVTSEVGELKPKNDKFSHRSDEDDNPVIEKTVVMLECEKPPIPIVRASEQETGDSLAMNNNKRGESAEVVLEYTAIRATASPLNLDGVDKEPMESHLQYQRSEVTFSAENGSPKFSSTSTDEKPYHAPFARVSSLEDPCTGNSEYSKAPPTSLEMVSTGAETVRAHVTDYKNLKLEKIPEDMEKPRAKESSKGIRKLLMFGKKNRSSADRNGESQSSSLNCSEADDYATNTASSSEASVHTLKNLISQDETPTPNATSQKSSRHFSLLSPFRIKTSEKKLTT